jgi:hypothetical protein
LLYSDAESFGKVYSDCSKKRLADNDIVILLTFYETAEKVKLRLGSTGIDVNKHLKEGSLIIADAAKEIFGEKRTYFNFC